MPAATFSRARDIFRKPSLKKSAGHTDGLRQDISVPSIDATLSLLYSPQNAVFAQTDALHVTPAGEYSRYAHLRPGWGEQQCQRADRPPAHDAPGTPARRRGSAPSGSLARPSRAELLGGHAPSHDAVTARDGPQRTMTLGRRTRRGDDAPRGPALTPSPKRYGMFYDDQTPFLEAASQLFGPVPSPEVVSSSSCVTPPRCPTPEQPHARLARSDLPYDVTADADLAMDTGKLLECQHPVESAHELYFTVDVLHSSDDGDVTLVFTDYPRWL